MSVNYEDLLALVLLKDRSEKKIWKVENQTKNRFIEPLRTKNQTDMWTISLVHFLQKIKIYNSYSVFF